jgi:hypothetical protein
MEKSRFKVFRRGFLELSFHHWFGFTPQLRDSVSSLFSNLLWRDRTAKPSERFDTSTNEDECERSINASDSEFFSMCTDWTIQACDAQDERLMKQRKQDRVSKHDIGSYFEPEQESKKNPDLEQFLLNCNSPNVESYFRSSGVDSDLDSFFEPIARRQTQENYSKRHPRNQGVNDCSAGSCKFTRVIKSIVVHKKNKKRKVTVACVDDYIDDFSTILTNTQFDDSAASYKKPTASLSVPKEIFCNTYFWDLPFPGVCI